MKRTVLVLAAALSCMALAAEPQKSSGADSSIRGIDLHMFSSRPTFGAPEDPTFWVHAERGEVLGDPPVWKLENTKAVIYRDPEEDIVLVAKSGNFDEENKSAQLDGGVRVTSGNLVADLSDIHWNDETGVARTDALATLYDGVNRLAGKSMALYADEDRFEIGEGSGRMQLAAADTESMESKSTEFESISIPTHSGIIGNLSGRVAEIRGPVELILNGVDPANTLSIKADRVGFEYDPAKPDEKTPSKIILDGHVSLKHAEADFQANKGTIDLGTRVVRFEGDVKMSGREVEGASGESFALNLDTGDFELLGEDSIVEKMWLVAPPKAEKPADPKP